MTPFSLRYATYWATSVSLAGHLALGAALVTRQVDAAGGAPQTEPSVIEVELVSWPRSKGVSHSDNLTPVEAEPQTNTPRTGSFEKPMPETSSLAGAGKALPAGQETISASASAADVSAFQDKLLAHIARHRFYPDDDDNTRPTGVVIVQFMIEANGSVSDAWVYRGGGSARLDRAAIETVMKAQPLPRPPAGLPSPLKVLLPVDFADTGAGSSSIGGL